LYSVGCMTIVLALLVYVIHCTLNGIACNHEVAYY
jgi:hypothetical protein